MEKFYNPVRVSFGSGSLSALKGIMKELEMEQKQTLLLIWDELQLKSCYGRRLMRELEGYSVIVKEFTASNPDIEQVYALYEKTKTNEIALVIAVGGGSVLDTGKSLCCMYGQAIETVEEFRSGITNKSYNKPGCKWIGIPTTAGTGSEVTCWATIWDNQAGNKLSLESPNNYAYAAILEPGFTYTMPKKLAVSSALDAVAHATESYWAKGRNGISRIYALKAIRMIAVQLQKAVGRELKDADYEVLSQGSMLAGLAFSNTKTTACHSISYPLTLKYKIPHGVAVSMLIGEVMEANMHAVDGMNELLSAYGAGTVGEVRQLIMNLLTDAGIETSLEAFGVLPEELPEIAGHCFTAGRMENNPAELDEENVLAILSRIFENRRAS